MNSSVARVFIGVRKLHHGHACEVPSLNPPKIKKLKKKLKNRERIPKYKGRFQLPALIGRKNK